MFRKSAVLAALLMVMAPRLFALGLGEITMQSALNQPMQAVIDLTSSAGTPIDSIKVSLASLEAHQRAGLTKSAALMDFKFTVEKGSGGNAVVHITSHDPVREPYLEFLLEIEWPNGHLLRQYTVLVDPPVTMPATPSVPPAPVTQAAARPTTPEPVRQVRPPASRPATAPATVTAAPAAVDEYGPIRRSETLWSVAERVRPDSAISMHQMMLALLRANPDAFVNGNMNLLKAGVTLKVPGQDEIVAISAREALAETRRQYNEWKSGKTSSTEAAATPATEAPAKTATARTEAPAGARLQLVAPEGEAVEGAAAPGNPEAATAEPGSVADLTQQLALATEEVEAGKAQSLELQSRVDELEQQVETMKRLLELKDDALAGLQGKVAGADEQADTQGTGDEQTGTQPATAETPDTGAAQSAAAPTPADGTNGTPAGIMSKVMDNPVLAGAGILVALLLGGFLWLANRQKNTSDMFEDEMTLETHLAKPVPAERNWPQPMFDVDDETVSEPTEHVAQEPAEHDPITEAEVYLAYGRIQQAEDVLQAALQREPDNDAVRLKLLEVFHIAGNTAAFEQAASDFRDGVTEDDARWLKVASMGYTMSPDNELYRAGAPQPDSDSDSTQVQDSDPDFGMDLSGMDAASGHAADDDFGLDATERQDGAEGAPEDVEYGLDELEDEDTLEGMLASEDEVTTKLDLARAYIDMDDKDSARSILGEVMEEGNAQQKQEAEKIFAQIA